MASKKKTKKKAAKKKAAKKKVAKKRSVPRACGMCGVRGHNARSHDPGGKPYGT